ncbi:dTDP-4-dehydrorhamnose reductase [Novosphingobium huizhouense]|uniref:dTDP-4-dehydrorhamnose reductase n=1 Tax=Novosphingobium huizhouense TaxID=2866625 RepID=UPI001CD89CDB|nr:dTDP-4-dehydrorhamnose reductase [Novosphingobium huizhouense]
MRVIVTGSRGQLARCLADRAAPGDDIFYAARPEIDLESPEALARLVAAHRPELVINAAAFTQVDAAESEPARAMQVNAVAPDVLARAAAEVGALLVHVSTDYVFDGRAPTPYAEDAAPSPINLYGRSKLAGEQAIAASGAAHVIARVSWLFSEYGRNFVRTMLALAESRDAIDVVADQRGVPNYAGDVADALWRIARTRIAERRADGEIVNVVGRESCTWADFAEAIFAQSARLGGPVAEVRRVPSSAFPTPAARPANSVLDAHRLEADYGFALPSWRDALEVVVGRILAERGIACASAQQSTASA